MHLSLSRFQLLNPRAQLAHVFMAGIFLAARRHATGPLSLYHLADGGCGFFAEVGLDGAQDCFVVLRSFSDSGPLAEYAQEVRLPE